MKKIRRPIMLALQLRWRRFRKSILVVALIIAYLSLRWEILSYHRNSMQRLLDDLGQDSGLKITFSKIYIPINPVNWQLQIDALQASYQLKLSDIETILPAAGSKITPPEIIMEIQCDQLEFKSDVKGYKLLAPKVFHLNFAIEDQKIAMLVETSALWMTINRDGDWRLQADNLTLMDAASLLRVHESKILSIDLDRGHKDLITYRHEGNWRGSNVHLLLTPLMRTQYFQQLKQSAPIIYATLLDEEQYLESGKQESSWQLAVANNESARDESWSVELIRMQHQDNYGAISMQGKLVIYKNKDSQLINQIDKKLYVGSRWTPFWQRRWQRVVRQACANLNKDQQAPCQNNILRVIPDLEHYQYHIWDYDISIKPYQTEGDAIAVKQLFLQNDKFAVFAKASETGMEEMDLLVHNYQKMLGSSYGYLQKFLPDPQMIKQESSEDALEEVQLLLNESSCQESCKQNLRAKLRVYDGRWHLENECFKDLHLTLLSVFLKRYQGIALALPDNSIMDDKHQ